MPNSKLAHKYAYEDVGILHRDISVGNILITTAGGLLIDWDLCKHVRDLTKAARQSERTVSFFHGDCAYVVIYFIFSVLQGTWQFIAARLLLDSTTTTHNLADDLESFLHVLTWMALRYTPHALDSKTLTHLLITMFDESYEDDRGISHGGETKASYLLSDRVVRKAGFNHPILPSLLESLTETFAVRYEKQPSEVDIQRFEVVSRKHGDDPELQEMLSTQPAGVYLSKMKSLENSDWMLDTLSNALLKKSFWPVNDGPVVHPLSYNHPSGKKRKSCLSEPELTNEPKRKKSTASSTPVVPIIEVNEE